MLDLDRLSSQELALVGKETGEECGSRLRQIAEASDPSDHALKELLEKVASDTDRQARSLPGEHRPDGPSCRLKSEGIRAMVRGTISFLSKSFGEGKLPRDIALYYAECLAEELSCFYRKLADRASESRVRAICCRLSECEQSRRQFLRGVVLRT